MTPPSRWLVALGLLAAASSGAAAAPARGRVWLTVPDLDAALAARIGAELTSAGFQVVTAAAPPRTVAELRADRALAALVVEPVALGDDATLRSRAWVAAPETGGAAEVPMVRSIDTTGRGGALPRAVALTCVELLRAALGEAAIPDYPPEPEPPGPPAAPAIAAVAVPPAVAAQGPAPGVRLGLAALGASARTGLGFAPLLVASLRWQRAEVDAVLAMTVAGERHDDALGDVQLDRQLLAGRAGWAPWQSDAWRASAHALAGVHRLALEARPREPTPPEHAHLASLALGLGARLERRVGALTLGLDATVLSLSPAPRLGVADRIVAALGRPLWLLGLSVGWQGGRP